MEYSAKVLGFIFGEDSVGATPEERAKTSSQMFVRSQDQLAFDSEGATGLRMTAEQALHYYGIDILDEVYDRGSAILVCKRIEPGYSLTSRRVQLGLSVDELAEQAGLNRGDVVSAEDHKTRSSIHDIKKMCEVLGLDIFEMSFKPFAELTIKT